MANKNYEKYYIPKGYYRKYFLRQEAMTAVDYFDYFSKLSVRINDLCSVREIKETTSTGMISLVADLKELLGDVRAACLFSGKGESKDLFCEAYDKYASVVDVIEERIVAHLEKYPELSEDAHILVRRSRLQKEPLKNPLKVGAAKAAWRGNRQKYQKAIKQFHKSTAGKAFHRNLNRFNKMRGKEDVQKFSENDVLDICKGVSSLMTHLLIEIQTVLSNKTIAPLYETIQGDDCLWGLFSIFDDLLAGLVEALHRKDREDMFEVFEIINDYYLLAEGS